MGLFFNLKKDLRTIEFRQSFTRSYSKEKKRVLKDRQAENQQDDSTMFSESFRHFKPIKCEKWIISTAK